MLTLNEIPAFTPHSSKGKEDSPSLTWGECKLVVVELSPSPILKREDAWQLLPDEGVGVITLADKVLRYDPKDKNGLLLDAEVVVDDQTTVVRSQGGNWLGWRWTETSGDTHRYVEYTFLSSEPGPKPPCLIYRQYWGKKPDDGLCIWQPVGSRFCGFSPTKEAK